MRLFLKTIKIILSVISLMLVLSFCCFAHSGGTDNNGGHTDHSTGKYHYHHGMPAHDHEQGLCPYDFDTTKEYEDAVKSEKQQKTIITISIILGASLLIFLHIITGGESSAYIIDTLCHLIFLPFVIIYHVFVGIFYIPKKIFEFFNQRK